MNDESILKIEEWARKAASQEIVSWDYLPEIYLYMDQVLTYLNHQLALYENTATPLTSSMINNYVKDGLVDRPEKKKYSREHLAVLTIICMLKPVLSIQDISLLLQMALKNFSSREIYEKFRNVQQEAFEDISQRVLNCCHNGDAELLHLAAELSIEANARRCAAEQILRQINTSAIS